MLFVAMSCLQGRPMAHAFDELAQLGVGIQLTPGNLPTDGFRDHVAASGVATRRHHGFSFEHRRSSMISNRSAPSPSAGREVACLHTFTIVRDPTGPRDGEGGLLG
jgi:hypothetical protein